MRRQDWQREEVRARQRLAERILGRSLSPAPHQWLSVADNPSSVADRRGRPGWKWSRLLSLRWAGITWRRFVSA